MILTKNLEICIIELPKYEKYISKNKDLNAWVKFIRKPEEINMEDINNNRALKKAKEVLEEISGDKREEELAFQRLMYKMDKEAVEAAGYDKGREKEREEIARKMLEQNIPIETIIECTGLTKEEIEEQK